MKKDGIITIEIIIVIIIIWKTYEVLVSLVPAFLFKHGHTTTFLLE
jgi:hypothetical protein